MGRRTPRLNQTLEFLSSSIDHTVSGIGKNRDSKKHSGNTGCMPACATSTQCSFKKSVAVLMKKILVIEDETSIRELLLELLTAEGFQAIAAEDGSVGVQRAQEILPDLILCDVLMPRMNGYEVLDTLRKNPATATIPLIFLTAMGTKENIRHGMELGADDYLTKPCTSTELVKAIASRFEKQEIIARQSQQQLNHLRSSIALSLPHELRTPLHAILGLAELLIDDHAKIDRQDLLEIAQSIHSAGERLHRLIQNFLLYIEVQAAYRDSNRVKMLQSAKLYYPKVLIASVATKTAEQFGRSGDLYLKLENTPLKISDQQLSKIVEEVTNNAFKFSSFGTAVSLNSTIEGEMFVLSVTDHGRGMTAEQIASLGAYIQFERGYYEQQGQGLGLAITKGLVELHGGELTITSQPGKQTTVCIALPIENS